MKVTCVRIPFTRLRIMAPSIIAPRQAMFALLTIAILTFLTPWSAAPAAAASGTDRLYSGERLYSGGYLVSQNGKYGLEMQSDGNLVIYAPGHVAIWSTNTGGHSGAWVGNQDDGNLVVYIGGIALWISGTQGRGSSTLIMQDDGNLVLYKDGVTATWASGTATAPVSDKLSDAQARQMLGSAGIAIRSSGNCSNRNVSSCTSLEQVRHRTIDGIIAFKRASGCPMTVTGGTEVGHSTSGTYTHWNGYKLDVSKSSCVTSYIHTYTSIGERIDTAAHHAPLYRSGAGDIYADEWWASHWDILYY